MKVDRLIFTTNDFSKLSEKRKEIHSAKSAKSEMYDEYLITKYNK